MPAASFRSEERIGLIVAIAAHAVLFTGLWLYRPKAEPVELPESVTVTLADEVGPIATSPNSSADPAPDTAPMAGDSPPPPEPLPSPEVRPVPQPVERIVPKPVTRPTPPKSPTIADLSARRPPVKPPVKPPPKGQPTGNPGGSTFDDAFKGGVPGGRGAGGPPVQFGPQEQTSLRAAIGAKVRGPWNACSVTGLDVSKLRASVTFTMDKAGRVTGVNAPVVTGVNDANRAQVGRFGECAVKAIRTAGPYSNLPPEFYDHWKTYKLNFRKE